MSDRHGVRGWSAIRRRVQIRLLAPDLNRCSTSAHARVLDQRIDLDEWAGGLPQSEKAHVPAVRIGRWWVNSLWLLPIGVAALLVAIALAQQLRQYDWMQRFIETYPGTSASFASPVNSGLPAWLRWQVVLGDLFVFGQRAQLVVGQTHRTLDKPFDAKRKLRPVGDLKLAIAIGVGDGAVRP